MRGEIIYEYRRLNSEDQKAFRRYCSEFYNAYASQTALKPSLAICLLDGPCDAGDHPSDHGLGGGCAERVNSSDLLPASFPKVR